MKKIITVPQFKIHLKRLGYGKTSVGTLPNCLQEFLEFTLKPIDEISSQDITRYYDYLQYRPNKRRAGGLSECYIYHHMYALKLFFSWQEEQGIITENPISSLVFKSPSSIPREILSLEEIKALYESCDTYKQSAVLSMYYGCGLRRSEGEQLNLKDIHFRSNVLYVRSGKHNKRRAVPLSEKVKTDLFRYATKERISYDNELAFICNRKGRRTSGSSYSSIIKKLLEKSGIEKQITLHSLRHSIATHLLENGLSVEYVRDFLGHKHLESTQLYTRVNNNQLWSLSHLE